MVRVGLWRFIEKLFIDLKLGFFCFFSKLTEAHTESSMFTDPEDTIFVQIEKSGGDAGDCRGGLKKLQTEIAPTPLQALPETKV